MACVKRESGLETQRLPFVVSSASGGKLFKINGKSCGIALQEIEKGPTKALNYEVSRARANKRVARLFSYTNVA